MATNVTLVGHLTAPAATDLRGAQYKVVLLHSVGVLLAHTGSLSMAKPYILGNNPNSGQACELIGPPDVVRTIVASTCSRGDAMAVTGTLGLAGVSSFGASGYLGTAFDTVTVGSGNLVGIHIR